MKKRFFLYFSNLVILLFFLISTALIITFLNSFIYKKIKIIKDQLLFKLEENYKIKIEYGKISPSIIGSFKINNIKIKDLETNREFYPGDILIKISIINFIKTKDYISLIKEININNLSFELDEKIIESLQNRFLNNNSKGINLNLKIRIVNSKLKINYRNIKNDIYISTLYLNINNGDLNYKTFFIFKNDYFSSDFIFNGSYYKNINSSLSFLVIKNLKIKDILFKDQKIKISTKDDNISISRVNDSLPIILKVNINQENIYSFISFKNFNPQSIVRTNFPPFLKKINSISLNNTLSFNMRNNKFVNHINGNIKLNDLSILISPTLKYNMIIDNNNINIYQFEIKEGDKEGNITINGTYNYKKILPILNININDYNVFGYKINTNINIDYKDEDNISFVTKYILVNDYNFGEVNYQINKKNIAIETLLPFNGLYINGNKNYLYFNINKFNLKPFLPYNLKSFFSEISISGNGKIIFDKDKIEMEKSNFTIEINKNIFNFSSTFKDNLFIISDFVFNNKPIDNSFIVHLNINDTELSIKTNYKEYNFQIFNYKNFIKIVSKDNFLLNIYTSGDFYIKTNDFRLNLSNLTFLKTNIDISYKDQKIEDGVLSITYVSKENNTDKEDTGNLNFKINYQNKNLIIENIHLKYKKNNITGKIVSSIKEITNNDNSESQIIEGSALLSDENFNETYSMNFNIKDGYINSRLFISNFNIKKVFENKVLSGNLNFKININGIIDNPKISMETELFNGKYNDKKLKAYLLLKKSDNNINIDNFVLDFDSNIKLSIKKSDITYSIKEGNIEIEKLNINSDFYISIIQRLVKFSINVSGNYISNKSNIELNILNPSIAFFKDNNISKIDKFNNYKLIIFGNLNELFINDQYNILNASLKNKILSLNIKNNNILLLNFNYNLNNNNGYFECNNLPIKDISNIFTYPYVDFFDGILNGKVELINLFSNMKGKLTLSNGSIILQDYLQNRITNISSTLFFTNNKINVVNTNGICGSGMVNGNGTIIFKNNNFESYSFIVYSDSVNAKFNYGPVDIVGKGKVNSFKLYGSSTSYNFDGDLFIEEADIFLNNNSSFPDNNLDSSLPIFSNIKFTTGKKVKFYNQFINTLIEENNKLELFFNNSDNSLNLIGLIKLKSGEINYFNKIFKIDNGSINFDTNQNGIDPILNIRAYYNTKDQNKNRVKIFLDISDRLSSMKTQFSSQPNLSQAEIDQLLGVVKLKDENSENNFANNNQQDINSLLNTTNYFGNTFLISPFESSIKKALNLDTFTLNSYIFGNLISFNDRTLSELLDKTSLSIGKYITDGFYLESVMTFNKKNANNDKVFIPVTENDFGLNLKLQVMIELPFINIGYSYKPINLYNFAENEQQISIETNIKF